MDCYVNIEDLTLSGNLKHCISIIEEEYNEGTRIVSCTEQYLTLCCNSDDFGEIKDLCSFITSTLLELDIYQFSIIYQE